MGAEKGGQDFSRRQVLSTAGLALIDPRQAGQVGAGANAGNCECHAPVKPRIASQQGDIDGAIPDQDIDSAVVMPGRPGLDEAARLL